VSTSSDRDKAKTSRRIAEELAAELERGRYLELEMARMRNSLAAMKEIWWNRRLEAAQVPEDRRCGTSLIEDFEKGTSVTSEDWLLAERLAKSTGKTMETCLWAVERVNQLNTPSYLGGEMIEKRSEVVNVKKQIKNQSKQAAEMAQFVANYRMTGADPALDAAIFKMRLGVLGQRIGQQAGKPVESALGLLTAGRLT
jgi:hypothetical protein